jgi:leader peptidase (prepilin peptidase)/N-methyltransferase
VESANGLLYYGLALVGGVSLWTLVAMALGTTLLVLSLIDLDHQILPNVITRPGIAAGVLASFVPEWSLRTFEPRIAFALFRGFVPEWSLWALESILAALIGYATFAALATIFKAIRGVEGLGQGDWKMAAMLGAFLGVKQLMFVVFVACVAGAVVGLSLMAFRGRDSRVPLPFGTFLGLSGIAALFVGDRLIRWYSTLLYRV